MRAFLFIYRLVVRFLGRNARMAEMLHDRVVERLVAFLLADLNHAGDLVGLAFANEVRDRHIDDENLQRGDSAWFVDSFEKILRDYALQRFGQGRADLVLLVRRENVDDSVNGF